jgi:hypothetical protein
MVNLLGLKRLIERTFRFRATESRDSYSWDLLFEFGEEEEMDRQRALELVTL